MHSRNPTSFSLRTTAVGKILIMWFKRFISLAVLFVSARRRHNYIYIYRLRSTRALSDEPWCLCHFPTRRLIYGSIVSITSYHLLFESDERLIVWTEERRAARSIEMSASLSPGKYGNRLIANFWSTNNRENLSNWDGLYVDMFHQKSCPLECNSNYLNAGATVFAS